MSAPTRRRMLTGAAVLVPLASTLPLATLPAVPDAVLLAFAAEIISTEAHYSALVRQVSGLVHVPAEPDAELSRLGGVLNDMHARMANVPALTVAGLRAKIAAIRASYPDGEFEGYVIEPILDDVLRLLPAGVA